ncbi:ParB/Srx family N-terminal domain-containing protein [Limibacter armeniacum]|uniref:ParB/Srx family N-terminal domain-containing protein n=1 Tax=Limibacter armeniacum TaxID=466084 RepID=UPI002FE6349A
MAKSFTAKKHTQKSTNVSYEIAEKKWTANPLEQLANKIKIDPELQEYIRPLREEEFQQLKSNIERDGGCHKRLTVWLQEDGSYTLVDGHHRLRACTEGRAPEEFLYFEVQEMEFTSKEEVKDWMDAEQLGRRNISMEEVYYHRGRQYNRKKGQRGGKQEKGENIAEQLADKFKLTTRTIKRNGNFAAGVDRLPKELQLEVLAGNKPLAREQVEYLGQHSDISVEEFLDQIAAEASKVEQKTEQPKKVVTPNNTDVPRFEKYFKSSDKQVASLIKKKDTDGMKALKEYYQHQAQLLSEKLKELE